MDKSVVFRNAAGHELTTKDLEGFDFDGQWRIIRPDMIPPEASRLHEMAREAGRRGDYEQALGLLGRAHSVVPDWPYPPYDIAYTHLLMGDTAKALEWYEKVDRVAPRGFFTCKTTLDCLRREQDGSLPSGFSKAFAMLELIADKAQKKAILESIVVKFPDFSPAWRDLTNFLEDEESRMGAITKGLECNPDEDTRGVLLIKLAVLLNHRGDRKRAIEILGELALDPQSTLTTEALAKAALAHVLNDDPATGRSN